MRRRVCNGAAVLPMLASTRRAPSVGRVVAKVWLLLERALAAGGVVGKAADDLGVDGGHADAGGGLDEALGGAHVQHLVDGKASIHHAILGDLEVAYREARGGRGGWGGRQVTKTPKIQKPARAEGWRVWVVGRGGEEGLVSEVRFRAVGSEGSQGWRDDSWGEKRAPGRDRRAGRQRAGEQVGGAVRGRGTRPSGRGWGA